jgi:kynurenine formamidase
MGQSLAMEQLLELLQSARVYDLAQPYYPGMPHHPNHPPFLFGLNKKHGDYTMPNSGSSASEALTLGGHVGTHIDALCHFSYGGKLHNGAPVAEVQSYMGGMQALSVDTIAPIFRRGILLDIAGVDGVEALPADFEITPSHLDAAARAGQVEIRRGDLVLLRTGWARFWNDAARFIAQVHGPGPGESGARWLSSRGVFAAGSDTVAFEKVPAVNMPVHVHLLVESGIHIIECLNLEKLAADRRYEFVFAAAPLKIRGGTGSPIRPVALAD